MRRAVPLFVLLLIVHAAAAQPGPGVSIQIYPAGQILQASVAVASSDRFEWELFAGYNRARRQDFGVRDDERGGGPGVGTAVRWFLFPTRNGLYLGSKLDAWFLSIDWMEIVNVCGDLPCATVDVRLHGNTNVAVVQPTAVAGYRIPIRSRASLDVSLAFGREVNAHTRGAKVGEGPILLGGLALRL